MVYIHKNNKIEVFWRIYKAGSPNLETFERAQIFVFLRGCNNTIPIPVEIVDNALHFFIHEGLPEGSYSIEAIWYKNWMPGHHGHHHHFDGHFHPHNPHYITFAPVGSYGEHRSMSRSKIDFFFAITDFETEQSPYSGDHPRLEPRTHVATYGYDGMNAFETAVFHGYMGDEQCWLNEHFGKDGQTPYIKDGNWWIGDRDTGVSVGGGDNSKLEAEIIRATTAEQSLAANINALSAKSTKDRHDLESLIEDEKQRATTAEANLMKYMQDNACNCNGSGSGSGGGVVGGDVNFQSVTRAWWNDESNVKEASVLYLIVD